MSKRGLILAGLVMLLLTGCNKEQEPVETESYSAESCTYDGVVIEPLSDMCLYRVEGETLEIFPHYENSSHIIVKKIVYSSNNFFDTIVKEYKETESYYSCDDYSYCTLQDGTVLGYCVVDEDFAYFLYTETENSSVVEAVLKTLCNTNI